MGGDATGSNGRSGPGDGGAVLADVTGGAVAGRHGRRSLRVLVGPATETQSNTIVPGIFPIACFKLEDIRFDFGSSVVLPEVRDEMPLLAKLIDDHTVIGPAPQQQAKVPRAAVFGHADPVGEDEFNKALSGRRAAAIYGMLSRRTEVWEDLYENTGKFARAVAGDSWGVRSEQIMLNALAPPDAQPLEVDGKDGPKTREALKRFQASQGLSQDGSLGPATRKALFKAYMDFLCVNDKGQAFSIDAKEGFLGRNADGGGKVDFQGCGEFNPIFLLMAEENRKFDKSGDHAARDGLNAPNRRVMVLLFRYCAKVKVEKWPCPRAKEDTAGCRKRFWSDGEKRRTSGEERRKFSETEDTFACRFYQRLLTDSPCEGGVEAIQVRLFDLDGRAMAGVDFFAQVGRREQRGQADGNGDITLLDIELPNRCLVRWSRRKAPEQPLLDVLAAGVPPELIDRDVVKPPAKAAPGAVDADKDFDFEATIFLEVPVETEGNEDAIQRRLNNLGYHFDLSPAVRLEMFRRDLAAGSTTDRSDGSSGGDGASGGVKKKVVTRHDELQPPAKIRRS
ncbi:MAG TPA: peptidoglycan-binding protein [Phycisphaerae bacterium]|nr:peptidoglycan-binding protein [Phycisphaerae bacterium]